MILVSFIVTLGWIIGKPLTLLFDPFESIVMFLAVIVVNYTVQDGKSNWLEGMILMCLYVMLAVVFWYYPGEFPGLRVGILYADINLNPRREHLAATRTMLNAAKEIGLTTRIKSVDGLDTLPYHWT